MYAPERRGDDLAEYIARALLRIIAVIEFAVALLSKGLAAARELIEITFGEHGGGQS